MELVKLCKNNVKWNEFCYNNTFFWCATYWMEYVMNSNFDTEYINHSFFIEENGEITGIVPLIQENEQLSFQGAATPQYICCPKHEKYVLEEIHRIAATNNVKRIHIQGPVKGYFPLAKWTCILNLDNVKPTKGHRSAIKKAEKYLDYTCEVDINKFREDYYRIAGKITRPPTTFDMLGQWIKQDFGILLEARLDDKTAGYTYMLHWKDYAYYFMSCTEYREYNVGHFLISKAIELLRQQGIKWLEMGEQSQASQKECNISKFKKSFGGQIAFCPESEYFFDKYYLKEIMDKRVNSYIENEYK